MKVLVTGGAGFVGRHLVRYLLDDGHKVTIFDNLSNSSRDNIMSLTKKGAKFVQSDILNYEILLKHVRRNDFVIHLAAKIDVEESLSFPHITNSVNVDGTINVLRACVESKVKNFIATSSAAVYGNSSKIPLTEGGRTMPISPYGASKLSMEHYVQVFSHSYDLNCIILRFFNIYGPGQSSAYAGVISKFMSHIKNDKPMIVFGDGKNTRDFVSIEDVAWAISLAMKKISNKKGNIYNIATGTSISINDLSKLMISISGKKLKIIHTKSKKGDIIHSKASIALAKRDLGYVPNIRLRDGMDKLIKTISF